ncbi:MAG: DUF4184 family protein [Sideroxydans sp.]|nr:DUF4184 family protein [Sideroxydans sp.]
MPFTPFHFGPGVAIHSVAPKRVSFLAFCVANVLIDVEPLYYMLTDSMPLHRFFHTAIGATLVAIATVLLFAAYRWFTESTWMPDIFERRTPEFSAVVAGAVLGTYSHILLDSMMHSDAHPFAPFSDANPLLNLVSYDALHWACAISGILGIAVLAIRRFILRKHEA